MTSHTLKIGIAVVAALGVVAVFILFNNPFSMSTNQGASVDSSLPLPTNTGAQAQPPQAQGGLVAQDEVVGTGAVAQPGDTISVNYTGKLTDGTVFDTSIGRAPFSFTLGAGQVIAGWDQGVAGMKVGGKRLLIVPAALGYGSQAYGPIPANSTLIFEVQLLKVTPRQ